MLCFSDCHQYKRRCNLLLYIQTAFFSTAHRQQQHAVQLDRSCLEGCCCKTVIVMYFAQQVVQYLCVDDRHSMYNFMTDLPLQTVYGHVCNTCECASQEVATAVDYIKSVSKCKRGLTLMFRVVHASLCHVHVMAVYVCSVDVPYIYAMLVCRHTSILPDTQHNHRAI